MRSNFSSHPLDSVAQRPWLISRAKAAKLLGVSVATIIRLEKEGVLSPVRLSKRSPVSMVLYRYEEVQKLAQ
ncbi:DNA-binding XRE family transcriptional regulator [Bradyrhizobium diazoefficiens]